jgi:hypothetical protein
MTDSTDSNDNMAAQAGQDQLRETEIAANPPEDAPAEKLSMEIHPIHGPILTLREFFVHLTIITLGILIALSLESLLEWQHHRSLVREARENLAHEISRNQKITSDTLTNIQKSEAQLNKIIETVRSLKKDRNLKNLDMSYALNFESLYFTSWNTANRSGAVNYMSYDEVEQYTEIYDQQQQLVDFSNQALAPVAKIGGAMQVIFAKDMKQVTDQELDEIARTANETLVYDQAIESGAKGLSDDFAKFASSAKR